MDENRDSGVEFSWPGRRRPEPEIDVSLRPARPLRAPRRSEDEGNGRPGREEAVEHRAGEGARQAEYRELALQAQQRLAAELDRRGAQTDRAVRQLAEQTTG